MTSSCPVSIDIMIIDLCVPFLLLNFQSSITFPPVLAPPLPNPNFM